MRLIGSGGDQLAIGQLFRSAAKTRKLRACYVGPIAEDQWSFRRPSGASSDVIESAPQPHATLVAGIDAFFAEFQQVTLEFRRDGMRPYRVGVTI